MDTITQEWTPTLPPADDAPRAPQPLEIRFTGSGSEYFRIWIVNLLLCIVTLSLYRPWAKVRRLRYFYANTLVDGHAFDFHGNPKKMLLRDISRKIYRRTLRKKIMLVAS